MTLQENELRSLDRACVLMDVMDIIEDAKKQVRGEAWWRLERVRKDIKTEFDMCIPLSIVRTTL